MTCAINLVTVTFIHSDKKRIYKRNSCTGCVWLISFLFTPCLLVILFLYLGEIITNIWKCMNNRPEEVVWRNRDVILQIHDENTWTEYVNNDKLLRRKMSTCIKWIYWNVDEQAKRRLKFQTNFRKLLTESWLRELLPEWHCLVLQMIRNFGEPRLPTYWMAKQIHEQVNNKKKLNLSREMDSPFDLSLCFVDQIRPSWVWP